MFSGKGLWQRRRGIPAQPRNAHRPRLLLEALEDRCTPSAVWYVNDDATGAHTGTSWADAFPSLQSALAAAQPGDEVWVARGTYTPTTTTDRTVSFALRDGVDVYGGFAGTETEPSQRNVPVNVTTLSGGITASLNAYHVVTAIDLTSATRLDGFTITSGAAKDVSSFGPAAYTITRHTIGGGLYVSSGTTALTLANLVVTRNTAFFGGGAAIEGTATLSNVTFDTNTTLHYSTGRYTAGGSGSGLYSTGAVSLTGVSFTDNSALRGGGMYNGATATLTDVTFTRNRATGDSQNGGGGGLFNGGTATLTRVSFTGNRSDGDVGGGVYNGEYGTAILTHVSFTHNWRGEGSSGTAGFYNAARAGQPGVPGGRAILTNVSFVSNVGAAFHNVAGARAWLTNVLLSGNGSNAIVAGEGSVLALTNATIFRNQGYAIAGATAVVTVTNSILWGNTLGEIAIQGAAPTVTYSNVYRGFPGTGNINLDPLFVDPAHGDFRLRPRSPAIDTGTNGYGGPGTNPVPPFDRDGNPRPVNATHRPDAVADMGAYEYQGPPYAPALLPLVAVGTQTGEAAVVALYNAAGQRYTLQPYGDSFTGGVRVAVADLNQDGVEDLVTAPGPGGLPLVKIYSGADGTLLAGFEVYGSAFTGGVFVAAADVLGLGAPQVVTGPDAGGTSVVKVFDLRTGQPALALNLQVFEQGFKGGVTVAAANGVLAAGTATQGRSVKVYKRLPIFWASWVLVEPFGEPFTGGVTLAASPDAKYLAVGQRAGTSLVNLFHLSDLSLAATLVPEFGIPHDPAYPGGTSVGWTREADGTFNLLTGTGPGWPARVQYWVAGTWQRRTGFSDFGGYPGGLWVA